MTMIVDDGIVYNRDVTRVLKHDSIAAIINPIITDCDVVYSINIKRTIFIIIIVSCPIHEKSIDSNII